MSNKILKYVRAVVFIAIVVGLVKCMDYAMMPSGARRAEELPEMKRADVSGRFVCDRARYNDKAPSKKPLKCMV